MPVEHVFFLSVDLVELALEYGFAGKKGLLFWFFLNFRIQTRQVTKKGNRKGN